MDGLQASVEKMRRDGVGDADELPDADGADVIDGAVVIKLNGGLGTSMGMTGPKSLVEVKDGQSFLDLAARQVLALRESAGARLPPVLMNSFYTREESPAAPARHAGIETD